MSVGLPANIMTTTHGLLVVADKDLNDLFIYCPHFGVMRGLGNFDDNPRTLHAADVAIDNRTT